MNTWNAQTTSAHTEYIDKKEVARRLHKDVRTINRWMKQGLIPYYRTAHSVFFIWEEVKQWVEMTSHHVRRKN